jgi:hypothetical protein
MAHPCRAARDPLKGATPAVRQSRPGGVLGWGVSRSGGWFHGILGEGTRSGDAGASTVARNAGRLIRWLAVLLMGSALGLAQADDMPTYRLTAREGRFEPVELVVPQGVKFRLEITNAGRDPVEFESLELRKEKVLAPGVTSSLVFRPLDAGRYRFFDDFHQTTGQGAIVAR